MLEILIRQTAICGSALSSIKMKWGIRNRTQLAVVVAQAGAI